jgi:predicted Fe-Mo cluster-binding NifX family protein
VVRFLRKGYHGGAQIMLVAVTIWDGRVSPVFDVSREALVLTIEKGALSSWSTENIEAPSSTLRINRLVELGIETLICGAVSEPLFCELTARGIVVFAFVAGEVDEVVEAFMAGALPEAALSMPGCCGRRNRLCGGRGRRGRQNKGADRNNRP